MTHEKLIDTNVTQDNSVVSIFKEKVLVAIKDIRDTKRRPDLPSIYNQVIKTEASNADEDFIESIIVELINENKIYNKKTRTGLDSFYIAQDNMTTNSSSDKNTDQSGKSNISEVRNSISFIKEVYDEVGYDKLKEKISEDIQSQLTSIIDTKMTNFKSVYLDIETIDMDKSKTYKNDIFNEGMYDTIMTVNNKTNLKVKFFV